MDKDKLLAKLKEMASVCKSTYEIDRQLLWDMISALECKSETKSSEQYNQITATRTKHPYD